MYHSQKSFTANKTNQRFQLTKYEEEYESSKVSMLYTHTRKA
jgi:hypothetical protein